MLNKKEVAEMIFRPCQAHIPESLFEKLISGCMTWEPRKLASEFTNSTRIELEYAGGNLYRLKY